MIYNLINSIRLKDEDIRLCFVWFLSFVVFIVSRELIKTDDLLISSITIFMFILLGHKIRRGDIPKPYFIVIFGIGVLFTFDALLGPISIAPDEIPYGLVVKFFLADGRWLLVLSTIVSFWFPIFSVLSIVYRMIAHNLHYSITGFKVSFTHWITPWEFALYLIVIILLVNVAKRALEKESQIKLLTVGFMTAVAVHFANYFFSGIEKMRLDGGLFYWVTDNPTYALVVNTWLKKGYPLAIFPDIGEFVYQASVFLTPLINSMTLFIQLSALIAICFVSTQRIYSFTYDVMHITIFVLSGIFFWHWIVLNSLILISLRHYKQTKLSLRTMILMMGVVLLSPFMFKIAFLGWYDTKIVNHSYFEAETMSGKKIELPSSFGLYGSMTYIQDRAGKPFSEHPRVGSLGMVKKEKLHKAFNACDATDFSLEDWMLRGGEGPKIDLLSQNALYIVHYIDQNASLRDDWWQVFNYAHHNWSNPWLYPDLEGVNSQDIVKLNFVMKSTCVSWDHVKNYKTIKLTHLPILKKRDNKWVLSKE